ADVARKIRAADHVEDDVDAASAGEPLNLGGEIGGAVVEGLHRAELATGRDFLVRAGGGVDRGAERARELDRGDANPRGAAMHQRALARGQSTCLKQIGPDGEIRLWQGGSANRIVADGKG